MILYCTGTPCLPKIIIIIIINIIIIITTCPFPFIIVVVVISIISSLTSSNSVTDLQSQLTMDETIL